MYGLVNRGLQELVISKFGKEQWDNILLKANQVGTVFVNMQNYDDQVSLDLLGAAQETLGISIEALLEEFGKYWVQYTAQTGYEGVMNLAGNNLLSFVQNLDEMHSRLASQFPELNPPSFDCQDITKNSLTLHYYSDRNGLLPLVIGCMKGLATKFDVKINIKTISQKTITSDPDILHLEILP